MRSHVNMLLDYIEFATFLPHTAKRLRWKNFAFRVEMITRWKTSALACLYCQLTGP